MASFAELDRNNKVIQVVKISNDEANPKQLLDDLYGEGKIWVQTYFSRKDFAGIGYKYNKRKKQFIPPKPHKSWIWNAKQHGWECPKKCPGVGYVWNEEKLEWELMPK